MLHGAAALAWRQADYSSARSLQERALVLGREKGDKQSMAVSLNSMGNVAYEQGDYSEAHALHEEGLALHRELGDKWGIAISLGNIGLAVHEKGDFASAQAMFEESMALRREIGDRRGIAESLAGLGVVAVGIGQVERGAKLLGAVQGLLHSIGTVLERDDRLPYERAVTSARSALGEETFEKAWQQGRGMSLEEAVDYASELPK